MAWLCGLSAVAGEPAKPAGRLSAMTEAEVRMLLSDAEIGPECCDNSEAFYRDGTYVHLGIAPDPGKYTVSGNRVCVTTAYDPQPACRRIVRDTTQQVFMIADGKEQARAVDARLPPDRSYWQGRPASEPVLKFESPPGYVPVGSSEGDTAEYALGAERDSDRRSAWITRFIVRDDTVAVNDYIKTTVIGPVDTWPGATRQRLTNLPENGYGTLSAKLIYPDAFPGGVPRVEYVKIIEAEPVIFFVRHSFRGQPEPDKEAEVLAWLKTVWATSQP